MVCHGDAGRGNGPYRLLFSPARLILAMAVMDDYTDLDYFWRISEGVPWSSDAFLEDPLRRRRPLETGALYPLDLYPDRG